MKVWVCVFLLFYQAIYGQCHLHQYVNYFETLNYDKDQLIHSHHRVRRSQLPGEVSTVRLSFDAFGKNFNLQLKPDSQHTDFELIVDDRPYPKSLVNSYYYTGRDLNDPSVYVYGSLAHGVFDGTIHDATETYNIEPAERYYNRDIVSDHSVIYRLSDAVSKYTGKNSTSFCRASSDLIDQPNMQHVLNKRQSERDSKKTRCELNVVADYFFYKAVSDGDANENVRVAQTTSMIKNIILGGSNNFQRTDFDSDNLPDEITFAIRKLTVETSLADSRIPDEFIGVGALLQEFSKADFNDYCLSYLFTFRDFADGVLGLAFVADVGGRGGVCDKATNDASSPTYNTGIVTLINYGEQVTRLVSQLTFTHEAGHNFGSNHDPAECIESDGNNYVMFARASAGKSSNNNRFSQCSIDYIFPVLRDRAQSSDDDVGCLKDADDNCGNQLVDQGEYCDCGNDFNTTTGACLEDACCNGTTCMLAMNVECSPQQGPCCDDFCTLVPSTKMKLCSDTTDCAYNQTCNGTVPYCPVAEPIKPKEGETAIVCNGGSNYCVEGDCTGSICVPLLLADCECEQSEYQCHVCCRVGDTCFSTVYLAEMNDTAKNSLPNGKGGVMGVGFPCNKFEGYCDFFNVCRLVNSDGAIKRLSNFIEGTGIINDTVVYIQRYWWAGLVGVVVILFGAFLIVIGCHFFLPRPEHMKKRGDRRRKIRDRRTQRAGRQ